MIELVIIWSDGSRDIYEYGDREAAKRLRAECGLHSGSKSSGQESGRKYPRGYQKKPG